MNKPRGKASVRQALIEAATELFAERGPDDVSVRELAAHAGVNHGLVHRHFGSKDGLLQATMKQLAAGVADSIGPEDPGETLADLLKTTFGATQDATHWRILARSILDGTPVSELQDEFPVVSRMLAAAARGTSSPLNPHALVTLLLAGSLGLLLFEPYLREATGQQADSKWRATREELAGLALRSSSPTQSTKK
jgi:AcrR family transcriptional regulator